MDFGQPLFYPDTCHNILLLLPTTFLHLPWETQPSCFAGCTFYKGFFLKNNPNPEIAKIDFLLSTKTQLHLVSDTGTHVHTYLCSYTPSHSPSFPAPAESNQP